MRKALLIASLLLFSPGLIFADQYIQGYTRKDGTYVSPHYRSDPDGNPRNNYSYPGNVNPYTGKRATGDSDSYLERSNRSNSLNPNRSFDSDSYLYSR